MKISLLQKTEIQKAISLASRASAWNSRSAALQRAFDVATKYEDMYGDEPSNQASVKLIVEKLLEHTLNGVPTPAATPNRLRKATEDIICLCDSGSDDDNSRIVSQQLLPRSLQRSLVLWTNRTTKTNRITTTRMLKTKEQEKQGGFF